MDIFDFIKGGAFNRDMVSINIPRDDMKKLIVVIAINTAVIEGILRDYRGKLTKFDAFGLENAFLFGKTVVTTLSMATGFTHEELAEALNRFINSVQTDATQKAKVYFNKSKEDIDSFVARTFGNEGT